MEIIERDTFVDVAGCTVGFGVEHCSAKRRCSSCPPRRSAPTEPSDLHPTTRPVSPDAEDDVVETDEQAAQSEAVRNDDTAPATGLKWVEMHTVTINLCARGGARFRAHSLDGTALTREISPYNFAVWAMLSQPPLYSQAMNELLAALGQAANVERARRLVMTILTAPRACRPKRRRRAGRSHGLQTRPGM